ncbi:gastrula zinc finger protein XlCGF57.1-like [Betta splendens]|uniref:Gastrula zinc finger protein XlCGF57.1-like n=1 Tax=Betta splendens TaxID=158456 RepID=A0A6P7L6I1_BETSP|nr:gastrula zinc finger protein XlCGF57.1-like [Betta splendens]
MTERRALSGGLSAALQRILRVVERILMRRVAEASPEVVQKQLAVAAEEIFQILGEYENDLSKCQCQLLDVMLKPETNVHTTDCDKDLFPRQVHNVSLQPHFKDASTETDPGGQQAAVPSSEAWSDCAQVLTLKSNKERTCRRLRQRHEPDCCKMFGRSLPKEAAKKNTEASPSTRPRCCRVCGKCFQYKRSFFKHVLRHEHSTEPCGVCGKRLDSKESLKEHLQAHSEENSSREQTDVSLILSEWKNSEGAEGDTDETNRTPCSQTAQSKSTTEVLNTNKIKHSQGLSHLKYCCKVCDKSFCYRASFFKHVQEDERDTDMCGVCGKHQRTPESLRLHLQTHVRANLCEVCGKHFDGLKQLEMHTRTHTGEKPYVCSTCGKAFAQNGNLMGHMRAHRGEKPYACSVCGQSFGFKEYMTAHMRIHTGEKPFLCSVCGKGFRQRGTLKTHAMIHTGESTHQCSVCDKRFYKRGALKIHMRSHTGEKPYLCNVCGKRFTAGSSLSKHMGVHDGK